MRCDPGMVKVIYRLVRVSIHTPTWGVTYEWFTSSDIGCFNPHTYMRCDADDYVTDNELTMFQSTHLHEVWLKSIPITNRQRLFQSTHLHEVWHIRQPIGYDYVSFNPHTYMRCDFARTVWFRVQTRFNPHTYMRCDPIYIHFPYSTYPTVSIHTPTWGVTWTGTFVCSTSKVSIHTPTWGVTRIWKCGRNVLGVSIHTPTWGVTFIIVLDSASRRVSIHTPTWGVT